MISFMCLGMSLGAAIGVATDNLAVYMSLGKQPGLHDGRIIYILFYHDGFDGGLWFLFLRLCQREAAPVL